MSDFKRKTISEWQAEGVLKVEDGNHGENRPRKNEFCEAGMAFIRAADMRDGAVLFDQAEKIDEVAQARVRKGIGQPNDILISHKGTVGRVARAPGNAPSFVCSPQTTFWRVLDENRLDRDYLFALMRSFKFQAEFATRAGETDMAGYVSLTSQRELELELPPIDIQRNIGRILGALDDKIALNRRMSATLEEMARALYRSWFVDFDPVHARALGQSPAHMDATTAALFPDSLGSDGLPKGWTQEPIIDQASWVNGAAYKNMHFSSDPDALPVVKIAELKAGITASTKFTATDLGERYRIGNGELLFSWSGNPDTSIDAFVWTHGDAWLNQHIFAVRENGRMPKSILFSMLRFFKPEMAEIARNKQTTGLGHITRKDLEAFPITVPTPQIIRAFESILAPIYSRYFICLTETNNLAKLRDTLLPRLMSGELRIRQAEKQVEEIV